VCWMNGMTVVASESVNKCPLCCLFRQNTAGDCPLHAIAFIRVQFGVEDNHRPSGSRLTSSCEPEQCRVIWSRSPAPCKQSVRLVFRNSSTTYNIPAQHAPVSVSMYRLVRHSYHNVCPLGLTHFCPVFRRQAG